MSRPVNADAAATRQRILDVSLALFSQHGVGGTSIRKIASESGVSLAMVHHYFGSKDALHKACIDAMYEQMIANRGRIDDALRGGGSPGELVDRMMRAAWRFAREHQVEMRLLMRSVMEAGELQADYRERAQEPFLREVPVLIGAMLRRPPAELRLPLQSINNILVRYAISTERELCLFAGIDDPAEAKRAVEDHLVRAARTLFGIPEH
jgi:AcrR family transcriptional regulator